MKKLARPLAALVAAFMSRPAAAATKLNPASNRRRTFAALLAATIVAVGFLSLTPPARAQAYFWSNFAGKPGGAGNSDGTGAAATFGDPAQVAVDGNGNVYVADYRNNAIRKVTPAGVVTTFAGSLTAKGSADGTGNAARFSGPNGVAIDGSGNLYVADTKNDTIRKITPAGVVSTLAGSAGMAGSTDDTGSLARFNNPVGVTVDVNGNVYVADISNETIRKITPGGAVSTLAGSAGMTGSMDGMGSAARFSGPAGLTVDTNGNVYVADANNYTIRRVTPAGAVSTLAGSAGNSGSADGTGSVARFSNPDQLALDGNGNICVADYGNQTIRKVTPAGAVTTFAGSAGMNGFVDGTGSAARFRYLQGVAVDHNGNIYVGDSGNYAIRKVTPAAVVTTLAGSAYIYGSADGTGTAARFDEPNGVGVDASGNVYVADTTNQTIRKITPAGVVTTLAGSAGTYGSANGTGSAAQFDEPEGLAVDRINSLLYTNDRESETLRKITFAGVVTTPAGSPGNYGTADGTGAMAQFGEVYGSAVDKNGNIYVADTSNDTIRKVTPAGAVSTFAGSATNYGFVNGMGSAARFDNPMAVAVDSNGNVYVADYYNNAIRKITPAGAVTTLAGSSTGAYGFADGTGSAALFDGPQGVAVDGFGNVFVADSYNYAIRKVTPAGVVTTIGGNPTLYGAHDGIGEAASFSLPMGIAVSPSGLLYVTDYNEDRVIVGTPQYDHDFNGDGYPDFLLFDASTLQTAIWHLSGAAILSKAYGPTLPSGWSVVGAADFNGDGKPDYLLFNASTLQTSIWYMNDSVRVSTANGPTLPAGWKIAGVADFNGDGKPDYLLLNTSTLQTAIWYLNNNVRTGTAYGPTLPSGWTVAGVADFNGDGKPDLLLFDASTLQTAIWYLNGPTHMGGAYGPTPPSGWTVAGVADFNGDGMPDYVLFNASTLQTAIWYLNGVTHMGGAYGPTLPAGWSLVAP